MIFSINKTSEKTTIEILGIRINFSDKTLKKIHKLKDSSPTSEELGRFFIKLSKKGFKNLDNVVWIEYIQHLVLCSDIEDALKELKQYKETYPNLKDIERFLFVANFACKSGISNNIIEKASDVYEELERNTNSDIFKQLINGKSVAVVGNGPSEVGKGSGAEIDSHDIVIRFNNYHTKGFEADYGSKTTIHIKGLAPDILHGIDDDGVQLINYTLDPTKSMLLDGYLESMIEESKKYKIAYFKEEVMQNAIKNSTVAFPTAGFTTLMYLFTNKEQENIKDIGCYGFSYKQTAIDNKSSHYFEKRHFFKNLKHDLVAEAMFLKKYLNY